jgi:hypothetical protein
MSNSLYIKYCLVKIIFYILACVVSFGSALVTGCMQYFSLDLKTSRVHLLLCLLLNAYVVYFCNEYQVLVHDHQTASGTVHLQASYSNSIN